MPVTHYIAMDVHSYSTEICVKTRANKPGRHWEVATSIAAIRQVLKSIRAPRHLTFEEGPLASWLYRGLKGDVEQAMVCDPRKNALVAKGGDKSDPIDANKLSDLLAGGFLKEVHQTDDLDREAFKQLVARYHERVAHRVSESNKIVGWLRRWGVVVTSAAFADAGSRKDLLGQLPAEAALNSVRLGLRMMLSSYDQAVKLEERLKRELVRRAKKEEVIVRWCALPGIKWIRAATLFVYLDTPWRFESKSALWKYLGIGLTRSGSGKGPEVLRVERGVNRRLKYAIICAAKSVIEKGREEDPFVKQYQRWKEAGLSPRNARRNVARSLAAVAWGMWKNGGVYQPSRVGVAVSSE